MRLEDEYYIGKQDEIPKLKLTHKHLKLCILLPHRKSLLSHLPKKGTVAEIGVANGDFSQMILWRYFGA